MHRSLSVVAGVLCMLVASACRPAATVPAGAQRPWTEMNRAERHAHMTAVVLPEMRAVFQRHDAERYAAFGCETCHGPDAAARGHAMPNPALIQLPHRGFRKKIYEPHREMVRFMWSEVQPTMARLLGQRESRFGRGAGFSCRGCHVARAD
jgi:cytochrome c553